jgi:hypothetical protein
MDTNWNALFDRSFDKAGAVALHAQYRRTLSQNTLEDCFTAFVPLVGAIFRRRLIHRQDFDDAFSAICHRLWNVLQSSEIEKIDRYLNVFIGKAALNFMRTHPLYCKRLNPRPDGRPFPKVQISIPDSVYLEELVDRAPEVIATEATKNVRHGKVYRNVVIDAIQCHATGAKPDCVKLAKRHRVNPFVAAHLSQVAQFLVRRACAKLRSEVSSFSYRELVE